MTAAATLPLRRKRVSIAVAGEVRRRRMAWGMCTLALLAGVVALFSLAPDRRFIFAPMVVIAEVTLVYMMVLWARDGAPPVFEAGTLCTLAIAVYGLVPLAGFLTMRGNWDFNADGRLLIYPFDPKEIGTFGWRYALYATSFVVVYLAVRGRSAVRSTAFRVPHANVRWSVLICFAALYAMRLALKFVYGYDPGSGSYTDLAQVAAELGSKPYIVLQIGHNVLAALFVAQQAVILLLLAYWRKRWCRWALILWLGAEVTGAAVRLGSRALIVLLLITAGVLYHRLVRRVSFRLFVAAGAMLLIAFMTAGALRNLQLGASASAQSVPNLLRGQNEFQVLFTTAFDIHKRKETGQINHVPWQLYVSDFYLPIPSQLLPFEKIDPAAWYIDVIGSTGSGVGFMFGVMSQAVLGLDWVELAARGAVLALLLALLHRWYVRRALYFWPTLLYLFVSVCTYYTFRASTFYFVYFVIYNFLPVMLAGKLLQLLLTRMRGARERKPVTA